MYYFIAWLVVIGTGITCMHVSYWIYITNPAVSNIAAEAAATTGLVPSIMLMYNDHPWFLALALVQIFGNIFIVGLAAAQVYNVAIGVTLNAVSEAKTSATRCESNCGAGSFGDESARGMENSPSVNVPGVGGSTGQGISFTGESEYIPGVKYHLGYPLTKLFTAEALTNVYNFFVAGAPKLNRAV